MAWLSRMAGGGWPHLPSICDQLLYALPILFFWPFTGFWTLAMYASLVWSKIMGTRQYLDMGYDTDPIREPNNVDFLIRWLKPHISGYWYDAVGNTVIGLVGVIPIICILCIHGYGLSAMYIGIYGILRGLAYVIGWSLIPNYNNPNFPKGIQYATEIAEYLSGGLMGLGIALAFMVL